jgi:hypothetical protein
MPTRRHRQCTENSLIGSPKRHGRFSKGGYLVRIGTLRRNNETNQVTKLPLHVFAECYLCALRTVYKASTQIPLSEPVRHRFGQPTQGPPMIIFHLIQNNVHMTADIGQTFQTKRFRCSLVHSQCTFHTPEAGAGKFLMSYVYSLCRYYPHEYFP